MNRVYLSGFAGIVIVSLVAGERPGFGQGLGSMPSLSTRRKNANVPQQTSSGATARPSKVKRPTNLNAASEYLQAHGSSALGGNLANGSGGGNPKVMDPLSPDRDDPAKYANQRHPAPSLAPKKRSNPGKPRVPPPVSALKVRRDRSSVNGIAPQNSFYRGSEGSRCDRETDRRAELARTLRAKPSRPSPPKPRSPSVKKGTG